MPGVGGTAGAPGAEDAAGVEAPVSSAEAGVTGEVDFGEANATEAAGAEIGEAEVLGQVADAPSGPAQPAGFVGAAGTAASSASTATETAFQPAPAASSTGLATGQPVSPSGDTLPRTGIPVGALMALGLASIASGELARRLVRRREVRS